MPELGRRVGVNKSTIQRYEADGVDPKRTMVINGLAEALLTTPEWLTGLSMIRNMTPILSASGILRNTSRSIWTQFPIQ